MAKALDLQLAGLWTSPNDYTTPAGALDVYDNCVLDQKNLGESRRGFEIHINNAESGLDGFAVQTMTATDYTVSNPNLLTYRLNRDTEDGRLLFNDLDSISGNNRFLPPVGARRVRMTPWGIYTYVTSNLGIQRYSRNLNSSVPAGIAQALDLILTLSGSSGFLTSNEVASITATVTSGSANLTQISNADIEQFFVGQIITGTNIAAGAVVNSITLSQPAVIYSLNLTAGSTSLSCSSNAGLSVGQLVSGTGIQTNTRVSSITGAGPYTITLSLAAIETATAQLVTFSSDNTVTMSLNATGGAPTIETISLSNGSQIAYRLVWGLKNENDAVMLGAPSSFTTIVNTTGATRNISANASIPEGITTDNFYQLYRSVATPTSAIIPPDQMQLVAQGVPTPTDISNGYLTITDQTPDSLKGEALYTGTDVEGISQANYRPPVSIDMAPFRGYMLYANVTLTANLQVNLDGVGAPLGVQIGDTVTITDGTSPFTLTAANAENTATGHFLVVTTGTPAQNIADTAASFIRVLNRYPSNTIVYTYLLSGPSEVPGQMLIEARAGISSFNVTASAHGDAWTPSLTTAQDSTAENIPNGIIFAKVQEPEAAPRINLKRAGGLGLSILRVIPLRDYVIVITTDGFYRVTGTTLNDFVIEPFDLTVQVVGPETAVALGNECWALTTQGVVSVSDGGVRIRSALQINFQIQSLIRQAPTSVRNVAFAVGYEADQRYILSLPDSEGDEVCTQQYWFNYITDAWGRWTRVNTAGYVNRQTGLYFANGTNSNIVLERKNGDFTDYVDESIFVQITAFGGLTVTLSSVDGLTVGDILWQTVDAVIVYSEILAIDIASSTVTVAQSITWTIGTPTSDTRVLQAISNVIQWKPMAAGDPTEAKQHSEGQFIFRTARFSAATARFASDISPGFSDVVLLGKSGGGWGLFPWGQSPWGGVLRPTTLRFYVPADKQYAGVLIVRLEIRSGYSNWKLEGGSISLYDIGFELGGPGNSL